MAKRRRYSQAFKEDAVRLMRARGTRTVADIAAELGVNSSLLHSWNQALGGDVPSSASSTSESDDVEALRRRLRQVEQENALLKKAAALLAKDVK